MDDDDNDLKEFGLDGQEREGLVKPLIMTGPITLSSAQDDADIYVDPTTGDDANPGTQAHPVKTLDRALRLYSHVSRGGTIYMAPGNRAAHAPITVNGEPVGTINAKTSIEEIEKLTNALRDTSPANATWMATVIGKRVL